MGLLFESATGQIPPNEMAAYTKVLRGLLNASGWEGCHILVHIHRGFGFGEAGVQACLSSGATGVWAGVSNDGAVNGHAGYCATLTNLVQIGNTRITEKTRLADLSAAAKKVFFFFQK